VLRKFVEADLLAIDDFACLEIDPTQAKLAFQVISERYDDRRPTAITTNRPFKEWPKVFPDALNAQVLAEPPHRTLRALRAREGIPHPQHQALTLRPDPSRSHLGNASPTARASVDEHRRTFGTAPFAQRKVVPWSPLKPLDLVPAVTAGNQ
jgi:hypothetical protein